MGPLQVLEETFSDQGFHVLGFYSNDFGNQGGDGEDINACIEEHNVNFEQFLIAPVTNPDPQPVFEWLLSQENPGPASTIEPVWNFHKYLISREGELVAHFPQGTWPGDNPNNPNDSFETNPIVIAIQDELAK